MYIGPTVCTYVHTYKYTYTYINIHTYKYKISLHVDPLLELLDFN